MVKYSIDRINRLFKYWGPAVEFVLDRLPTATILAEEDEAWN